MDVFHRNISTSEGEYECKIEPVKDGLFRIYIFTPLTEYKIQEMYIVLMESGNYFGDIKRQNDWKFKRGQDIPEKIEELEYKLAVMLDK